MINMTMDSDLDKAIKRVILETIWLGHKQYSQEIGVGNGRYKVTIEKTARWDEKKGYVKLPNIKKQGK